MKESEKSLDPQLWHACAGSMVQIPPLNSKVIYFPQGHAEHSLSAVDFPSSPRIPALVFCRVASLKFMADTETDEVFAKILLIPFANTELHLEDDAVLGVGSNGSDNVEKPASFAKTLTQSDANNGGGFSVPRYCAETIFPPLDYTANPPVQTVIAKDVHGQTWKFRHIYRGTPRRHLLTTGWSNFVNHKKLVAGDSIVFLRSENGELRVGIRRAKRPENGNCGSPYGGFPALTRNANSSFGGKGKLRAEAVAESVALAGSGQPFEVVYYPRASTPEFCVKESAVKAAMRVPWCSGMRFKMPFETEDSSRISWFVGTVSSVQVADPIRWPNSPWRLLQVTWDEPDLLQNVKRVSPWLVELVSNVPSIHLSPFSPPRKKSRLPQHPDVPFNGQFLMSAFSSSCNPLGTGSPLVLSDNAPAGIQGARHAQFGLSLSDPHLNSKLQSGLFLSSFPRLDPHSRISDGITMARHPNSKDNISCLLTIGNSNMKEKSGNARSHQFFLFGQPILTEQQLSRSYSSEAVSQVINVKSSSDGNADKTKDSSDGLRPSLENRLMSPEKSSTAGCLWHQDYRSMETGLEISHCKVFMDSEDVGRTLDLSVLGSYEQLYRRLANMFGIERSDILGRVLYRDATGAVKQTGDEPFCKFMKTAKRLTIRINSSNEAVGRSWLPGIRTADNGLEGSNKRGPLSIFA
ncbi:auxin response factor 18-like [Hibiscus syriacus]|uniref:auxin response factor 18-like n=1 Tax=Hibiscus syriacus TaxID=106335 RepID=UPI001924244A|nr:auxin response factor 18-like [Hibiscus syriacus]XP_039037566.1 auxin response factor 18-like [Hibiscus syriacus]